MKAGTNKLFKALGFSLLVSSSASAMAITLSTGDVNMRGLDDSRVITELASEHAVRNARLEVGKLKLRQAYRAMRYCDSDAEIDDFMPGGSYEDDSTDAPQSSGEVVFEDVSIFSNSKYFTESFQIETGGTYQAVLTDFNFPAPLQLAGLNITTATESLGTLTGPGSFMFDAGPGDYYVSFFGNARQLGQYGIEISMASSAVPVPAAVWLFSSGLLGLVGVVRKKAS